MNDDLWAIGFVVVFVGLLLIIVICVVNKRDAVDDSLSAVSPPTKPQFTTELEALIAIEANTRQALELLRQQNKKSFWSMLFLFGMFSDD